MNSDTVKTTVDVAAYTTVFGTLVGWLPAISAICGIIWFGFQVLMNWDKIKESFNKHIRGK